MVINCKYLFKMFIKCYYYFFYLVGSICSFNLVNVNVVMVFFQFINMFCFLCFKFFISEFFYYGGFQKFKYYGMKRFDVIQIFFNL